MSAWKRAPYGRAVLVEWVAGAAAQACAQLRLLRRPLGVCLHQFCQGFTPAQAVGGDVIGLDHEKSPQSEGCSWLGRSE